MARPKGCRGGWIMSRLSGRKGDEMPKLKTKSGVKKALQAHGDRQDQAWCRWQAPPADQPQRQVHSPEPRHRSSRRRRHGARETLGALRPQV